MKRVLFVLFTFCVAYASFGSGFAILEQSTRGMGRALGGITADKEDLGALYFNPSATAWLESDELTLGAHFLRVHAVYKDLGSSPSLGTDEGNDMGGWSVIPNFYWGHPIEEGLVFGLGFSATSGTKTSHPRGWIGRYDGILTDIAVVDVNPAISYRLGDDLSIGAGLVFEYAFMKMDSAMDLSALGRRDGKTKIEGDSTSVGFNLGVTYEPLEGTTVGLGYRSRMRHKMDVNVRSHGTRGLEVLGTRSDGTSVLHFPSAATIGIMQKLTERWRAGLDIAYCFQSYMKDIRVKFDDKYMGRPKDSEMKIRMGWKNSWRISLGTEYDLTERLTLRGGFTWDQSPVTNRYRNVQLPDADRYWLSVGLGCRITEKWTLDLAWTHIFFPNVSLNQAGGGNDKTAMLRGKASGNSNTVSVALSCRF